MSRAGKLTDNPVDEALNGWIKEELMIDYQIEKCRSCDEIKNVLEHYNALVFTINYDTPVNYRKRYYKEEVRQKETFSKGELSEIPKFIQKRKKSADNERIEQSVYFFRLVQSHLCSDRELNSLETKATPKLELSQTKTYNHSSALYIDAQAGLHQYESISQEIGP